MSFDTGDKAIQCGRHNDIFKFWLMWRSKGMEGYRAQINRLMDLAAYFTLKIKSTDGYEMVIAKVRMRQRGKGWRVKPMGVQPEYLNICFWYVPPGLRKLDPTEKNARLEKVLNIKHA